jgi:predicted transcriptional regulator
VLKQVEAGRTVKEVAREMGVSEATIYTWKSKYGGMEVSEARLSMRRPPLSTMTGQNCDPAGAARRAYHSVQNGAIGDQELTVGVREVVGIFALKISAHGKPEPVFKKSVAC